MKKKRLLRPRAGCPHSQNSPVPDPCPIPKRKGKGEVGGGMDRNIYTVDESYPNHRMFFWSVGDG
jgi:hypothetical protein